MMSSKTNGDSPIGSIFRLQCFRIVRPNIEVPSYYRTVTKLPFTMRLSEVVGAIVHLQHNSNLFNSRSA